MVSKKLKFYHEGHEERDKIYNVFSFASFVLFVV